MRGHDVPVAGEAVSDDHVCVRKSLYKTRHQSWIVLSVRVNLNDGVVVAAQGELEPRPHGATDTQIERQRRHVGANLASQGGSGVRRAVVHDEYIQSKGLNLCHNL